MKKEFKREIFMDGENSIRVTRIENTWYETPGIRINKIMPNGHVLPGPEVPDEFIEALIKSIRELSK